MFFSLSSSFLFPLIFLGYFAPLPLFTLSFIAGCGEVLIAGAFGTFLIFIFSGEAQLLSYALFYVVPPVCLGYLLDCQKKEKSTLYNEGGIEAFVGQGLLLTGIFLMVLFFLIFENSAAQMLSKKSILQVLQTVSQDDRHAFSALLEKVMYYIPGLMSLVWMVMTLGNIFLAQVVAKRFKKSLPYILQLKHWPLFHWQYWVLAVSMAGSLFLSPPESFWMQNLFLVALAPFLFEGVAIFHEIYPKITKNSWGIFVCYGLALVLGWPILILIFVGIFEPWFQIRQRFAHRKLYIGNKE